MVCARAGRVAGGGVGGRLQTTPEVEAVIKAKVVMVVKCNLSACQI